MLARCGRGKGRGWSLQLQVALQVKYTNMKLQHNIIIMHEHSYFCRLHGMSALSTDAWSKSAPTFMLIILFTVDILQALKGRSLLSSKQAFSTMGSKAHTTTPLSMAELTLVILGNSLPVVTTLVVVSIVGLWNSNSLLYNSSAS